MGIGAPPPPDQASWGFIEWLLGAAWVVLMAFGEMLRRAFRSLQRRAEGLDGKIDGIAVGLDNKVEAVEKGLEMKVAAIEKNVADLDHDVRGVRQNQIAVELTSKQRHDENREDKREMMKFIADEMRHLGERIDRLVESRAE